MFLVQKQCENAKKFRNSRQIFQVPTVLVVARLARLKYTRFGADLPSSSANIRVIETFNQDLHLKLNQVYLKTSYHTNFQKNWWSDKKVLLHTRPSQTTDHRPQTTDHRPQTTDN